MKKVFLSAPISGFDNQNEYASFRQSLSQLVDELKKEFQLISEIEEIKNCTDYETPEQSAEKDFCEIRNADVFLLIHPKKMQTSALIELGYAFAYSKKIVIVGNRNDLPYLSLGLNISNHSSYIIENSEIDCVTIEKIKQLIRT